MKLTTKLLKKLIREALNEASWDEEEAAIQRGAEEEEFASKRSRMAYDLRGEPADDGPTDKSHYAPREVNEFRSSLSGVYGELRKFNPDSYEWDWSQNKGIPYDALSSPEAMDKHINKILSLYKYEGKMTPEEIESIVRSFPEIEAFFRPIFDLAGRTHPAATNSAKNLEAIMKMNSDPAFWEKINSYRSLLGWPPTTNGNR